MESFETGSRRNSIFSIYREKSRKSGNSMGELSSVKTMSRSSEEGTSLSGREVNKCKKLILKKEREERRNNIVIKKLTIMEGEGDKKEKVKK